MDAAPTAPEVEEAEREIVHVPLVLNRRNFSWLTERISGVVEQPAPRWWWVAFTITASAATFGLFCLGYQISTGVGTWGNNIPVGWAWDITNFVFWIGIGHAGTLISAILFLLRQKWRTSINRSAEAMTLFAVICAAIFPGVHVGRVWMAWYLAPVPNNWAIWPNFRSALMWDVFAVSTYFTVSVLFWYTGLVPDLATLRDRARTKIRKFLFGIFALGWRGSNRHWRHYEMAYLLLAGLSTPLVRYVGLAHLAYHDFPAVLCRGRDLWRLCHGADVADSSACDLQAVRCHYAAAHRQNGENHFANGFVRWLRLHDGIFRGVVQRQFVRAVRILEPHLWSILVVLVVWHAFLQLPLATAFLVQMVPPQHLCRVFRRHVRQRRHVVRTVHHYCRRSDTRFSPIVLESFSSDMGGHMDVHRHARDFYFVVSAIHQVSADDRNVRSEDRGTRGGAALR